MRKPLAIAFYSLAVIVLATLCGCGHQIGTADMGETPEEEGTPSNPVDTPDDTPDDSDDATTNVPADPDAGECIMGDSPVLFVNPAAPTAGNGLTWATAFSSIRQTVSLAHAQSIVCEETIQVWATAGEYKIYETSATDTLLLLPDVAVYGGFAGDETSLEQRDPAVNQSVLNGANGDNHVYHVVTGSDDALLDGFTITGGEALGEGENSCGGGMYNHDASPVVRDCAFINNIAGACGGGGLHSDGGDLVVYRSSFTQNSTEGDGGAIHIADANLMISTSVFLSNESNGHGAAIAMVGGEITLHRCTLTDNAAFGNGGALFANEAAVTVEGSRLIENTAEAGGGISAQLGVLLLSNSTLSGNAAHFGAGIYNVNNYAFSAINCTFFANDAIEQGGAIQQYNGDNNGDTLLTNNILQQDTPDEIAIADAGGTTSAFIAFNNISGGYEGTGNIDGDPLFVDPNGGDFRLVSGSPCIDTANDSTAPSTDMVGNYRVEISGAGPDGTVADMGAIEYQP